MTSQVKRQPWEDGSVNNKAKEYYQSKNMKCPKCNCPYVHTWLVAICYNCNYEGSRLEFACTEEQKEIERKFALEIPRLMQRNRHD